jgi:hypothetical protein
MVLGEQSTIVNHYNELMVSLINKESKVNMNIIFRVFDEGVAFLDMIFQNKRSLTISLFLMRLLNSI